MSIASRRLSRSAGASGGGSGEPTGPSGTIGNFGATATGNTTVHLYWEYSGDTLSDYTLKRNGTTIATLAVGVIGYDETGLLAGTAYTYTLVGNLVGGGTTPTASVAVTTTGGTPEPTGDKIASMWYNSWQGPPLHTFPADVKNALTHYCLGMAQGSGSGTMSYGSHYMHGSYSNAEHADDIRALVAAGRVVTIGIGGAGGNVHIANSTHVSQAVASIKSIVTNFGVNGIDIDIEAGAPWTQDALVDFCMELKSFYGSGFKIGVTTQMYGEWTAKWMNFLNALGHNNYDYTGPMLYDFPESIQSATLIPVAVNKADTMVASGVPQSRMVLGFMLQPHAGYAASENAQVIIDSYTAVKNKYPNIAGAFFWASEIDNARNWEFSRQVVPHL